MLQTRASFLLESRLSNICQHSTASALQPCPTSLRSSFPAAYRWLLLLLSAVFLFALVPICLNYLLLQPHLNFLNLRHYLLTSYYGRCGSGSLPALSLLLNTHTHTHSLPCLCPPSILKHNSFKEIFGISIITTM